jgi:hypothetical protein
MPQGTLFTEDFLNEGIRDTDAWRGTTPEALAAFRETLLAIVKKVILSTFPIVERKDRAAFDGIYLTRELILWYKRALEAGMQTRLRPRLT